MKPGHELANPVVDLLALEHQMSGDRRVRHHERVEPGGHGVTTFPVANAVAVAVSYEQPHDRSLLQPASEIRKSEEFSPANCADTRGRLPCIGCPRLFIYRGPCSDSQLPPSSS